MNNTFEKVKPIIFAHEGGYTNNPKDPGNWSGGKVGKGRLVGTNHGIAAPTLAAWRGRQVTEADMRALTRSEAARIFKARYWDTVRADDLPAGLDYAMYDFSVNSGPARAAKALQRSVGSRADGVIGPMTLGNVKTCGKTTQELINNVCSRRLAFMQRLAAWVTFKKGWSRRVKEVRSKSLELSKGIS